ncbi:uncharacterized protein BYT42DRAFT_610286 [Radiomyces spectabilis]|uniref:uncharacterized protein n=1 Tax=Radiomyces spectabilis TaxID=64574 RepID=UPI00222093F8|nr:uncharacterized protein BYT42DRAFT_610286 [Radiomyces spectabilis]KAI8391022.1 hypothetical protein BYT42DRAFT_610286 [Radiomyces spectabilis]
MKLIFVLSHLSRPPDPTLLSSDTLFINSRRSNKAKAAYLYPVPLLAPRLSNITATTNLAKALAGATY